MATCTPIYLSALNFNFPRSYVREVCIRDPLVTSPSWSGGVLSYVYDSLYTIILPMQDNVHPWSSNVYSIQFVWDIANCRAILGGVDQDFALYAWVTYAPDQSDLQFRVKVQPAEDTGIIFALAPAPAGYWLPTD